MEETNQRNVLGVSNYQKYQTVEELLDKSQPNQTFYTMLVLSSVIIAAGILINNIPVVIGGMLVTPLLTPILVMSLGVATGQIGLINRTSSLILKATISIIAGSLVLGFIFGGNVVFPVITNNATTAFLYFVVAFASGIAVTFAWVRKEASEVLPGVAIAVSLVPPLSVIGIALGQGEAHIAGFYALVYIFNLVGIMMGSLIVFSLSRFATSEEHIEAKEKELEESRKATSTKIITPNQ